MLFRDAHSQRIQNAGNSFERVEMLTPHQPGDVYPYELVEIEPNPYLKLRAVGEQRQEDLATAANDERFHPTLVQMMDDSCGQQNSQHMSLVIQQTFALLRSMKSRLMRNDKPVLNENGLNLSQVADAMSVAANQTDTH